ncbi:hypothetical protein BH20ACT21_BH20ACT21_15320 [soil metagenome]
MLLLVAKAAAAIGALDPVEARRLSQLQRRQNSTGVLRVQRLK